MAALLLWALAHYRLIDTPTLVQAASHAPGTVLALALLLLLPIVAGAVRYQAVLQAMERHVPLSAILTANVVSTAVSTWLPASAGVMEVMRFGLVVRSTRGDRTVVSKTDLAIAGVVDRLLGLATVALLGLLGGSYLLMASGPEHGRGARIVVGLTMLLAVACALPFLAVRVPRIERAAARLSAAGPLGLAVRAAAALRQVRLRTWSFAVAVAASLGISITAVLAMYLAMALFAPSTPLLAVAIGFPLLVVGGILPGNIAGFGASQVAAAVIFKALALDPKAAVLASLLVSTVSLVTASIAGGLWAPGALHEVAGSRGTEAAEEAPAD